MTIGIVRCEKCNASLRTDQIIGHVCPTFGGLPLVVTDDPLAQAYGWYLAAVVPTTVQLRAAHRARMGAWGLPFGDAYENAVIARALADPPPESHEHGHEEMGMCEDCDAAALLEAVRE
jgi:hypothetical protein